MKKNKKLWKQKFRTPPLPPISSPPPPPVPGKSVSPPPAPDPADREEIRQILETAMLNLLREIRSRDLHELQLHTLITLTNNVARAVISNNRVQTPKLASRVNFTLGDRNNPPPMEEVLPLNKNANLRRYPKEWQDTQETPGVDPDEGREDFILNHSDVRQDWINLARVVGTPAAEIEAYLDTPEGKAEMLDSVFAKQDWDKKRGIKGRDYFKEFWEEREAEKQKQQMQVPQ